MTRPIFSDDAAREAAAAAVWHEDQRKGRGTSFLRAIEAAVDHIEHSPESFAQVDLGFRRVVVNNFPYVLLYRIEGDKIVIHAVFHTSQNPAKLRKRLRGA